MDKNSSLEHHGIKGQKWGIRRTPEQLGHKSTPRHTGKDKPFKTKKMSADSMVRAERTEAYNNRRTISDEELKARIQRLELERRFRDLSEEDLYRGRKIAKDILLSAGPQAIKTMTSGSILYAAKVGMTQSFNWKEAADYIAPKPKKK